VSITLIENEIRRLLSTKEPEVVCISGRWGVGKTFAWRRYLEDAHGRKEGIALKRYAYVSLFGINSLDDFKYAVFENSINVDMIGIEPSLETLGSNTIATAKQLGKKAIPFLQQIPLVKNQVGGLSPLWFLSVKETIVCVDDIERRGDNLSIGDVLGLVTQLKEQKKCKVIMILNDEQLEEETEKFKTYFDKVVDVSLKFSPSAEECVQIALPAVSETDRLLAKSCVALRISNIRLIKKIERSVRNVEPMLAKYDEQVLKQAVESLVLLGWCVYEPGMAPPIEFLQIFNAYMIGVDKNKVVSEREASWNNVLINYGFTSMDEFDSVLLDGIRDGYFKSQMLEEQAAKKDRTIKDYKSESSFIDAWELYHGSFDNNQEEVLDAIVASFRKNVQVITPINLNGTVTLLKELGRAGQAAEIIAFYVDSRGESRHLFDLGKSSFGSEVKDLEVREAFKRKLDSFKDKREPSDILLSIGSTHGWSQGDIEVLSSVTVDEYYRMLKENKGDTLGKLIGACLFFEQVSDASEPMTEIVKRAKEALERIGEESAINARRVRRYGVRVEDRQVGERDINGGA